MTEPSRESNPINPRGGALPAFVGTLAALVIFAVICGVLFLGYHFIAGGNTASSSGPVVAAKGVGSLNDPATWVLNPAPPTPKPAGNAKPDISWWVRTFDLPPIDTVRTFLKNQGLTVTSIVPLHYEDAPEATTITYQVEAQLAVQLLNVPISSWQPSDPDLKPFTGVLVLNTGLPASQFWDTRFTTAAVEPGSELGFAWKLRLDKTNRMVMADEPPRSRSQYTRSQVDQLKAETANTLAELQSRVQAINAQVASQVQDKLAQVPANPPKPGQKSGKWGGDGSGEPTRSAERIGGGTVAGAAGGAAFGAAAGDAGLGAGIGAGVGLLGGLIYDGVSKHNDRERYQRRVAADNAEHLADWRAQVRELDQQRARVRKEAETEKRQLLQDLAQNIASANGHLDSVPAQVDIPRESPRLAEVAPAAPSPTAGSPSAPPAQVPADDAPNQPVLGASSQLTADTPTDLKLKQQLAGYWKSPRHGYCRNTDGIQYMLGGGASAKSSWDVRQGVYYEDGKAYDIVTLNPVSFAFRSRDADRTTFKEVRTTKADAER